MYRHEWQVGDLVIWDNRGGDAPGVPLRRDLGRETCTASPSRATSRSDDPRIDPTTLPVMAKSKGTASAAGAAKDDDTPSRRELAVARSLDSARTRAENRVQQFLDAAVELMDEDPNRDFTVQEVVDRSGQSLRSFYQYFDGKYELLLALFEESVRATVVSLRDTLPAADAADPVERLHAFVVQYHAMCRPARTGRDRPTPGMGRFAQQLLTEHPKEAAAAFGPLMDLTRELLDAAAAAGRAPQRPRARRTRRGAAAGDHVQLVRHHHQREGDRRSSGRRGPRGDVGSVLPRNGALGACSRGGGLERARSVHRCGAGPEG